jgi:hypothetical protein
MEKNELIQLKNKIELLIKEKETPFDDKVTKKIYNISNQLLTIAHELDSIVKGKETETSKKTIPGLLFEGKYLGIKNEIDTKIMNGESFSRQRIRDSFNLKDERSLDVLQVWMDKRYNRKVIEGRVSYGYGLKNKVKKEKKIKTKKRNVARDYFLDAKKQIMLHINNGMEINRETIKNMFPELTVIEISRIQTHIITMKIPCIKNSYGKSTYKKVIV